MTHKLVLTRLDFRESATILIFREFDKYQIGKKWLEYIPPAAIKRPAPANENNGSKDVA